MSDVSNIKINGTSYAVKDAKAARKGMYVGTCPSSASIGGSTVTMASSPDKVVTVDTFPTDANNKPLVGTIIGVKYATTNTYKTDPDNNKPEAPHRINVNNTGFIQIYYNNAALKSGTSANSLAAGYKNRYIYYQYDGTYWVWLSAGTDTNTTYSGYSFGLGLGVQNNASASATITVTLSNYALATGGVTAVRFLYDVPANSTMNINSKGAKSIYYKNSAITAGIIKAGDTATFVYSGQYHLIAIDRWDDDIKAKANSADLATVATSGSYNDLTNKPTLLTTQKTILYASGTTQNLSFTNSSNASLVRDQVVDLFNNVGNDILLFLTNPIDSVTYPYIFTEKVSNTRWKLQLLSDTKYGHVTLDSGRGNNIVAWENVLNTIPTVDSSLTGSSQTNPVQGGAIYSALQGKAGKTVIGVLSGIYDSNEDLTGYTCNKTIEELWGAFVAGCNVMLFNEEYSDILQLRSYEGDFSEPQGALYFRSFPTIDGDIQSVLYDSDGEIYVTDHNLTNWCVPQTRKINNKPLSTDITLTASDVGAMSTSHPANAITSAKITEWDGKMSTDYVAIKMTENNGTLSFKNYETDATLTHTQVRTLLNDKTKNFSLHFKYSRNGSDVSTYGNIQLDRQEDYWHFEHIDNYEYATCSLGWDSTNNEIYIDELIGSYFADSFQEQLVSGTNIKTINNQSLLGSGNLTLATLTDVRDSMVILMHKNNNKYYRADGGHQSGGSTTWVYSLTELEPDENHTYVDIDTNKIYRWTTSGWSELSVPDLSGKANIGGSATNLFTAQGLYVTSYNDSTTGINIDAAYNSSTQEDTLEISASNGSLNYTFNGNSEEIATKSDLSTPIVTVSTTGAVTQALDPNKFYNFTGSPTSLTLTLTSGNDLCIYAGKFTAGTGFTNLSFPATVKVADGAPSVEAGNTYEFSVMNNLLLLAKEGA